MTSRRTVFVVLWCLSVVSALGWVEASQESAVPGQEAAGSRVGVSLQVVVGAASEESVMNPHSDLIFRATGAIACTDCHRTGKNGQLLPQVQDNTLVEELKAKAKGVHGPGRFADCLRCHAGGEKGVEKYRVH